MCVSRIDLQTGSEVAIKVIDLESAEEEIEEIRQEINVLSECSSPYITRYITSYTESAELCIVFCHSCRLFDYNVLFAFVLH